MVLELFLGDKVPIGGIAEILGGCLRISWVFIDVYGGERPTWA